MATNAEKKIARLMGDRLAFSDQKSRLVVNEGKKFWRHIFGDPPLSGNAMVEYLKDVFGEEEVEAMAQGADLTTVPMHGVFRQVLLPYLISRDGVYFNKNKLGAGEIEKAIGEIRVNLIERINENCGAIDEFRRAVDDAFIYRVGWIETFMDTREIVPMHEWVDARDVLIDCETRSPKMRDKRWVARKFTVPIETAEWMAENWWNVKKPDFEPVRFNPNEDKDYDEVSRSVVPGARRSDKGTIIESPTEFVRLVRVFVKGDNPFTVAANEGRKKESGSSNGDDVYDGKDHVLWMEASGGYQRSDNYKFLTKTDWPFPCPTGETPLTAFRITKDNRDFYPYNIMQPAHMLQVAQNVAIQTHNTDYKNSAKRIVAIDPTAFENEDEIKRAITEDAALPTLYLKPNRNIDQAIMVKDFGKPNPSSVESQGLNSSLYRIVSGMQKFEVEVRANQTAHNTAVQHEAAQVKLDDITSMVTNSIVMSARKATACARKNMTDEEVRNWIHLPKSIRTEEGVIELEKEETTSRGKKVITHELWTNNPSDRDIRIESDIQIEARSIMHKNPEKEAQDIKEIMDYQRDQFRIIGDTVGKGGVDAARAMAESTNNTIRRLCKLKNILNYEDLLIDLNKILPPVEPPPVEGAQPTEPAQPNPMGMGAPTPQQRAAATRLQQQGVSPEAIPAAAGGAG